MISGFLVKIVVSIALVGLILFEVGSPLVNKAQLDDLAHDAADNAALDLLNNRDLERAKAAAEEIVTEKDAKLEKFELNTDGTVAVTVRREARSVVLKKWSKTEDWYDNKVSVTSSKKAT